MRKFFVIDTSCLANDPYCFKTFNNSNVILPIIVLDELDKIKKLPNETGKNARLAIRALEEMSNQGEIHNGIKIENNINLKIDTTGYSVLGGDPTYGDNKILACAKQIQETNKKSSVILVSRDINLRIRAKAFGLEAQDYEKDKTKTNDLFQGHRVVKSEDLGLTLFDAGFVSVSDSSDLEDMFQNEFVLFTDKKNKGICAGRKVGNSIKLVKDKKPWGLELRSKEQLFAADLIMDPTIPLVSLSGLSGSGKTLVSLASSLDMVLNKNIYETLIIYRPVQPMGNDIGFLPGLLEEKLNPWFVPIHDSFALLFSDKSRKKDAWKTQLHQYLTNGTIQQDALTYIRGRSISNAIMLVDESQNLGQEEIKAILTRAGQNTKIVLTGDIFQIDTNHLDATNNGLTYAAEKFKSSELSGHIHFTKGERSPLATLASEIL